MAGMQSYRPATALGGKSPGHDEDQYAGQAHIQPRKEKQSPSQLENGNENGGNGSAQGIGDGRHIDI